MNIFTEHILINIQELTHMLEYLTEELERNSWEFEPNTEGDKFWQEQSNQMRILTNKIKKELPF